MKKNTFGVIAAFGATVVVAAAINISIVNNNQESIEVNLRSNQSLTEESACNYTPGLVMARVSRQTGDYTYNYDGSKNYVYRDVDCCAASSIYNACNTNAQNSLC
jgi:hypothetical protein